MNTNLAENAIRPSALGRRNRRFADTVKGAKASAALYRIVSTAPANGLEPYAYLRHLFTKLAKAQTVEDFEALLIVLLCSRRVEMAIPFSTLILLGTLLSFW